MDEDDRLPMRGPLHLSPDQIRLAYTALTHHPEPFFRRLAVTRLQMLDTDPDASTLQSGGESP